MDEGVRHELNHLRDAVTALQERNNRVEADKAWETSVLRVFLISAVTYTIAAIVLRMIGVRDFYLGALIPTLGFFLSVQTLPLIKRWWIRKHKEQP